MQMTALEYLREKQRMTKNCKIDCMHCPLSKENNQEGLKCFGLEYDCLDAAVSIVRKWAEEHPKKTMLRDFLEKYPNAILYRDGIPKICPFNLGYMDEEDCYDACKDCWNRPLEE